MSPVRVRVPRWPIPGSSYLTTSSATRPFTAGARLDSNGPGPNCEHDAPVGGPPAAAGASRRSSRREPAGSRRGRSCAPVEKNQHSSTAKIHLDIPRRWNRPSARWMPVLEGKALRKRPADFKSNTPKDTPLKGEPWLFVGCSRSGRTWMVSGGPKWRKGSAANADLLLGTATSPLPSGVQV
jgi:hypothetical protein